MSEARGFRYALQPVLLTRRWHVEQLQRDLAALNADLGAAAAACEHWRAQVASGRRDWEALAGATQDVQAYLRCSAYLAWLATQSAAAEADLAALAVRRDDAIDAVRAAQRALDAVEQHRQQVQRQFVRNRLNIQYRATDDLWSMQATTREQP